MNNRRLDFPASTIINWTNSTGSTVLAGTLLDLGANGYGIATADILNTATGAVYTSGRFELPKATGVTFAQGVSVGWDTANTRVQAATNGRPVGTLAEAALTNDTVAVVNLNGPPRSVAIGVVGNASGAGLTLNTGFGQTPTGCIIVQVTDAAGVARVVNSITWLTGGSLGQVTIVTAAGAGTDKVNLLAVRE